MKTAMHQQFIEISAAIQSFILDCATRPEGPEMMPGDEQTFNQLALGLFRFQYEHNHAYGRLCRHVNMRPDKVDHWRRIPAIVTSVFKDVDLTILEPEERTSVFYSSG